MGVSSRIGGSVLGFERGRLSSVGVEYAWESSHATTVTLTATSEHVDGQSRFKDLLRDLAEAEAFKGTVWLVEIGWSQWAAARPR